MGNSMEPSPNSVEEEKFEPGVDRAVVLEEVEKCSSKVSDNARYLAFGIIATCFSLLTSTSPFAKELVKQHMVLLVLSTVTGCIAAFFDLLQYNFGYWSSEYSLANGKQTDGTYYFLYDWRYYARLYSYRIKQLLVIIGTCGLVGAMSIYIYNNQDGITGKKPNRSQKALQIEKRKETENWLPITVVGLSRAYSENGNLKRAYFSNELIPSVVQDKLILFNRIRATCDGRIVAEMNFDDSNLEGPMGFEFKCYDASYRATLIETKVAK